MGKTLFEKVWNAHVVHNVDETTDIIYIDRHLVHEVTSPQAFAGLEARGIPVFRPANTSVLKLTFCDKSNKLNTFFM